MTLLPGRTTISLAALLAAGCVVRSGIDERRSVDLSHPFNESTVYWPTATSFALRRVAFGPSAEGHWYATNDFTASEHGGTHLDAPIHFAEAGNSTEKVPIEQLIAPIRVLDIRLECATSRDYVLSTGDIERHEKAYGTIRERSAVLVFTGHSRHYPDAKEYLGSSVPGSAAGLHFPGISEAAARLLVERGVDIVGIDTASLDPGQARDFPTHRALAAANVPGLENLTGLEAVPPTGATLIALPMKIEGGSGGPCRVIAVLP